MARLCERPACSNDAAVAYRFDAAERWVRLESPGEDRSTGVLCTRHADSMMVPRGWTLDDRREAVPRLFRLPSPDAAAVHHVETAVEAADPTEAESDPGADSPHGQERRSDRSPAGSAASTEGRQLSLDDSEATVLAMTERPTPPPGDEAIDPDATTALPWTPVFDEDDDLDGVLDADGELLARAFRGEARPKRT